MDEQDALRLQRGDRTALSNLIDRHYDALTGYLYRLMHGDRTLAQDLTQETFLRVLRGIDGYQYPRPFKPWLYAIATNLARNHYTSADIRRTQSIEADDDPLDEVDDHLPDAYFDRQDEAQAVIDALRSLPDHQREVIILAYYQSLALSEIAETLGIPLGTVKSRLSIGIARLREGMKARDDEPTLR